ncbi:MAG TPA: hypothetical protein VFL86_16340, partial [Burkholderiaceae bacterium]|nr:hypothetical protein [Burkholderiaceae bacterium]
ANFFYERIMNRFASIVSFALGWRQLGWPAARIVDAGQHSSVRVVGSEGIATPARELGLAVTLHAPYP